jgi:predicted ATPase
VDGLRQGNGTLAFIEGSAGIGKTRLLAEVRATAEHRALQVLSARGGELERDFVFGILRQLFEPLLATASADQRDELLAGAAWLSAQLFGGAGLVEAPAAGDASFAMLHGAYWLAANAALGRPTLLLIDDLHWADEPSLRWLSYLARRLEGLPLMVVVGTRPPQQSEHPALLTELLMDPAAVVLRPAALSREAVEILARDVFAAEPDAEFCEACRAATGGNPLFLRALLITLSSSRLEEQPKPCKRARLRSAAGAPFVI